MLQNYYFNKRFLLRTFVIALAFFLAAHAFCYFNLSLRGESLMLNAEKTNNASISAGQFLRPFYWRIRGGINSPFFIGLLSFTFLFVAELALIHLLHLTSQISVICLSGILFLHPALLELNVSALYTADATCLAFMCLTLGTTILTDDSLLPNPSVFPARHAEKSVRSVLACVLLFSGLGLEPGLFSVVPCILCIRLLSLFVYNSENNAENNTDTPQIKKSIWILGTVAVSILVYGTGVWFFSRRTGINLDAWFQPVDGQSFSGSLLYPMKCLFIPVTIYPHLYPIVRVILCAFAGLAFVFSKQYRALPVFLLLYVMLLLPVFGTSVTQFPFSFLFFDIACLMMIESVSWSSIRSGRYLRILPGTACLFLFLGYMIFANHAYLVINLDFDTSLSIMTQVIARLEDREDFHPGSTPVAFIGSLSDSPLVIRRDGFEHLTVMRALSARTSLHTQSQTTWYFWETLGYPFNCMSDYEQEQLAQRPEVAEMPVFPYTDSIQNMDGILVVRLSE